MFKFKNLKEIRTSISAILGGILIVAGYLWPDKLNEAGGDSIIGNIDNILIGVGGAIQFFVLLFGSKDPKK